MIPEIVLTKEFVVVLLASAVLAFPRGIWQTQDGRPRVFVAVACWSVALTAIIVRAILTPINDDEVFYLLTAWSQANGEAGGVLFLRGALFRPFLALGLSPSATIMLGRAAVVALAVLCAGLTSSMSRRLGHHKLASVLIGPVLLLWLGRMPMVFLRPEYFALAFFALGVWILLTPTKSWSRRTSAFIGFFMLALCSTTSLRQSLFLLGAFAVLILYSARPDRRVTAMWAILGSCAGSVPTALWTVLADSIKAVHYWNFVFARQVPNWLFPFSDLGVPAVLLGIAVGGVIYLWPREEDRTSARTLIAFWATSTLLAMFDPHKHAYALGPWLMLSTIMASAFVTALPNRGPSFAGTRWTIIVFALMGLSLLGQQAADYRGLGLSGYAQRQSQLDLIDWIDQTRGGGSVMCVTPYHPIRGTNSWNMSNAWWYSRLRVGSLLRDLDPGVADRLDSCNTAIIAWDPWQRVSEMDNIVQFWEHWGFIPPELTDDIARRLAECYIPVHWDGPLPADCGGGTFLVRKDLKLASGVTVLNKSVIIDWHRQMP